MCICTVPVNKKFTFDYRRTIVLRCERLRFVPNSENGNGTEQSQKRNGVKTVCKMVN